MAGSAAATTAASEATQPDPRSAGALQAPAPRLILASASASRRALLAAAGLRFDVMPAAMDEAAVKADVRARGGTATQAALALAEQKAASVTDPDALVIGCDQILVCNNTWFDKPPTLPAARAQLLALRGHPHDLVTATVCRRKGNVVWRHIEVPRLVMRDFSEAFLESYLAAEGEAVLTSVGAYRLEGRGMHLFDAIEGEHSAILGLPLMALLGFLRQSGILTS